MTKPISDAARKLRDYVTAIRDSGFEGGFVRRHWEVQANAALASIDAIDSEVTKAVPPGFVVMPDTLTREMMAADRKARHEHDKHWSPDGECADEVGYKAMIAARPPLPQSPDIAKVVPKRAPVQGYEAGIPWEMHLRAYDVYKKNYGEQKASIEGQGGFCTKQLDSFIPGWRDELSYIAKVVAMADELQAALRLVSEARQATADHALATYAAFKKENGL